MFDISIIVPVYNGELYLAACIESILKQTFEGRIQVILVDDKSTDQSLALCRKYASEYDCIELVEHKKNGGSAVARNSGLDRALGQYLMYVDPDDVLPDKAIKILFQAIERSGADIVTGSNSSFSKNKVKAKCAYSVEFEEKFLDDDCLTTLLKHEKLRGHPWGKMFRASSFSNVRFTPGYRMAQDLLYCAEAFSKAKSLLIIPDTVYHYRIHSGGATGRKYITGAYLSWLKCISEIGSLVRTDSQKEAYTDLKIRTLCQLARELRSLRGEPLKAVLKSVQQTRKDWLPPFWHLLLVDKVSVASIHRYLRYKRAIKKARDYLL